MLEFGCKVWGVGCRMLGANIKLFHQVAQRIHKVSQKFIFKNLKFKIIYLNLAGNKRFQALGFASAYPPYP